MQQLWQCFYYIRRNACGPSLRLTVFVTTIAWNRGWQSLRNNGANTAKMSDKLRYIGSGTKTVLTNSMEQDSSSEDDSNLSNPKFNTM
jgi:hypothetical protein